MKKILPILLIAFQPASAQVNLNQGLIAHYPFNGNTNDISGNNINGVNFNAALTTDKNGNLNSAYYFNGSNSYIELPFSNLYNFAPQDSFSISVWVLPDQGYSWPAQAVVVKAPPHPDFTLSQWNYGSYILNYKAMSGYSYNHILNGTTTFIPNPCWYNIITTYKNGIWKLYVNGVLEDSDLSQTKFILQDGFSKIVFGKKGESFGDWYKGKMDEVRLYNRVLNQEEINVLGGCLVQTPCNNWLQTQAIGQSVTVGDLDISGNQMTIEANFSCTSFPLSGANLWEDIVSKHSNTTDGNYVLRMDLAAITTTTGHYLLSPVCNNLELNKIFHVALVYDGASLKFYRNGFLLGQMPVTGNLILNNWLTTIGDYAVNNPVGTNFFGYINEVRIWNIARTQSQLQTYMNSSLPNPTTQTGLLGYYTFDNLLNKQGNPAFNGTLNGGATINNTVPNCTFTSDSCTAPVTIINNYTPVLQLNPCDNKITVEDATSFNTGDTVLLIQMKGAVIDSSNTATFGTIINYKNSGNYEFNYIKSKVGNEIELKNEFTKQYDIPLGKVQLVRVPYFKSVTITDTLTCLPWDGSKGGVLAFNVQDTLKLAGNMDVSGKGFRGGIPLNSSVMSCNIQTYYNSPALNNGGQKGESIYSISPAINYGKGAPANGGGGGNANNSGGGGGANAGTGGNGGNQWEGCSTILQNVGGIGGKALQNSAILNKLYLGGGGGMGHGNNQNEYPAGNGGGIIIIKASTLIGNNKSIKANGKDGVDCGGTNTCNDGMSGGGAGGSVLLDINTVISPANVEAAGGRGANSQYLHPTNPTYRLGPGGGGGGGFIGISQAAVNPLLNINTAGGINGVLLNHNNDPFLATPGANGTITYPVPIITDIINFKPNIDSVRIKDSATGCRDFDFKGFGYTNTNPVSTWYWDFGDGTSANTQNTSHSYTSEGTYTVKLVVTDINGCKDSVTQNISTSMLAPEFIYRYFPCLPKTSIGLGGYGNNILNNVTWNLGDGTIINNAANTILYTYGTPGVFPIKFKVSNSICSDSITKLLDISTMASNIVQTNDTTLCYGATIQLLGQKSGTSCWKPNTYLDDPFINTPTASPTQTIKYTYTAEITGANLIVNGDFNAGNTGFISDYIFQSSNSTTTGVYGINNNAQSWNTNTSPCTDHTTGTGNMLLVNGSTITGKKIWKQTVDVSPNTNYQFSLWAQTIGPTLFPAGLKISMANRLNSMSSNPSNNICQWTFNKFNWNSGNLSSFEIAIEDFNLDSAGNDFAIDDIFFGPVSLKYDSITITVDTPYVQTVADPNICEGSSTQLSATGGVSYSWSPATGLSNPAISNPIASPVVTTQYIVSGTNANGCSANDTVLVNVNPKPVIAILNDSSICKNTSVQLFATGGASYSWSPAGSLNNPFIANPLASPLISTTYYVTVTDALSCSNQDSVRIDIVSANQFNVNPDQLTCLNTPKQLLATGGNTYLWQPASSLNDASASNPIANPASTTTYSVFITETKCNESATLTTTVTVLPLPDVQAAKSNDIDCSQNQAQLTAAGALSYVWSPGETLNDTTISNPIATPVINTLFTVRGTDASGCINSDTITVNITDANISSYLMPTAFTPNGDGLNDCFGLKYWGMIEKLEFSIYNRWGERVFYTKKPGDCWDGSYKGKKQNAGVFIYMIKASTRCTPEIFRKGTFVLIR